MMRVFRIFLINTSYGFSGFAKEVTTRKSLRNYNLQPVVEECMAILVSLATVIWVVTATKQAMKS